MILENVCKIDSMGLFIPLDKVTMNKRDFDYHTKVYTTNIEGEILDEKIKDIRIPFNHYKLSIRKKTAPDINGNMVKGLSFALPALLLGKDYFTGINDITTNILYQAINSQSWLTVPHDSFINGRCSDIDFCKDNYLGINGIHKTVDNLKKICMTKCLQYDPYHKDSFFVGVRKGAQETRPYFKGYRKDNQYKRKYNAHSLYNNINFSKEGLYREEVTMKNKEFITRYSSKEIDLTLKNVLSINCDIVENVKEHYFGDSALILSNTEKDKIISELTTLERERVATIRLAKRLYFPNKDVLDNAEKMLLVNEIMTLHLEEKQKRQTKLRKSFDLLISALY